MTRLTDVDLIGVRFDGSGRLLGQTRASSVLRENGLPAAVSDARLLDDVTSGPQTADRGPSGFGNESALLAMVDGVYERTRASLGEHRFPLLYGADCAVLLGIIPALRDEDGAAGLLFVDAHEDATAMELSPDGEAANMEIALLLGLAAAHSESSLTRRMPALLPADVVLLGQRDGRYREGISVPSISDQVAVLPVDELQADLDGVLGTAIDQLDRRTPAWWAHVDLDVLSGDEFGACAAAGDPEMPGGLTWPELTTIVRTAVRAPNCRGLSLGVYNTDLDPDRSAARRIVRFLADVVAEGNAPAPV